MEELDAHVEQLWKTYWRDRSIANRNALIEVYYRTAHRLVYACTPTVDNAEMLYSYAMERFVLCIERYNPDKMYNFDSYLASNIYNGVKDGWRDIDHFSRKGRELKARYDETEQILAVKLNRSPTFDDITKVIDLTDRQYQHLVDMKSYSTLPLYSIFDDGDEENDGEELIDLTELGRSGYERLHLEWAEHHIGNLVSTLPEREKIVVTLYYYENMALWEIGWVLGVTESRACQIHGDALEHLRRMITDKTILVP